MGANATHGLRRTNADKRRAVETLLRDEEWGRWSDREIARRCGVHHELVGRLRMELSGGFRQIDATPRLVQRNGTVYEMDTSRVGTRPAQPASPAVELTPQVPAPTLEPTPGVAVAPVAPPSAPLLDWRVLCVDDVEKPGNPQG